MADDPVGTAATNNPLLSTLVAAVAAAGLVDTLNTSGPLHGVRPDQHSVRQDRPGDARRRVRQHRNPDGNPHLPRRARAARGADLAAGGTFATVNGAELTVADVNGTLVVNGGAAAVLCGDVPTANATVFLIDSVLMPPA